MAALASDVRSACALWRLAYSKSGTVPTEFLSSTPYNAAIADAVEVELDAALVDPTLFAETEADAATAAALKSAADLSTSGPMEVDDETPVEITKVVAAVKRSRTRKQKPGKAVEAESSPEEEVAEDEDPSAVEDPARRFAPCDGCR